MLRIQAYPRNIGGMYLGVAYQGSTLYATLFIGIRILHRVLQYIQPAVLKAYSEIFGIWLYGYELINTIQPANPKYHTSTYPVLYGIWLCAVSHTGTIHSIA